MYMNHVIYMSLLTFSFTLVFFLFTVFILFHLNHSITFYHFDGYIIIFFMIWAWEVILELYFIILCLQVTHKTHLTALKMRQLPEYGFLSHMFQVLN